MTDHRDRGQCTDSALAYSPQKGDNFGYSETTTVNNGKGRTQGTPTSPDDRKGADEIRSTEASCPPPTVILTNTATTKGVPRQARLPANTRGHQSNFTYVNGTDNQVGFGGLSYSRPLYVWFAMNPSLPVGKHLLRPEHAVHRAVEELQLAAPTENRYVQTIRREGTGQYQRNDSYGVFTASYTWYEYFDPTTGYHCRLQLRGTGQRAISGQAGEFHLHRRPLRHLDELPSDNRKPPLPVRPHHRLARD